MYVNDTMWVVTIAGDVPPLILFEAPPLHRAAFEGRTSDCAALVREGASLDDTTRWGHTALDLAIIGKHDETAIRLLELGAKTPAGASSLPLAVSLGRIPVVEAMFARGLDANATDQRGNTLPDAGLPVEGRDRPAS
jgi:ankyrin repeat protein